VAIEDRFLQPDGAEAEHVAQDHHRELHQHDREREPRGSAADRAVEAVDEVGDALGVVEHGTNSFAYTTLECPNRCGKLRWVPSPLAGEG
jgi:hypothetical protein